MMTMATTWIAPKDFEGWLVHVFDRPVAKPEWYWAVTEEADWEPPEDAFVSYFTQALGNPVRAFSRFSEPQVDQGLNFLINPSCSNDIFALANEQIDWRGRRAAVRAIYQLFAEYFLAKCAPTLSHLGEAGASPVNRVCYMWWDVFPMFGKPSDSGMKELHAEILEVMIRTLALKNIACQEAALHGLAHWALDYPKIAANAIDEFLARNGRLRPELKKYALQARAGRVQ